jgi:phosphatidylglycerophosphatase A
MVRATSSYRLSWRDGKDPAVLFICGFGSGFIRYAPGTWGSLLAVVVWWFALSGLSWPLQIAAAAVMYVLGSVLTSLVQSRYGVGDDSAIVVDEIAGQWLALLMLPQDVLLVAASLVLFRLFDIWKPGPIRWLERNLPGSQGVMADDVLAGLAAAVVLQLTIHTFS